MIIKLYDNQIDFNCLIEIKNGFFKEFNKTLKEYKEKNKDSYNDYEFFEILEKKLFFIRLIEINKEVYF